MKISTFRLFLQSSSGFTINTIHSTHSLQEAQKNNKTQKKKIIPKIKNKNKIKNTEFLPLPTQKTFLFW